MCSRLPGSDRPGPPPGPTTRRGVAARGAAILQYRLPPCLVGSRLVFPNPLLFFCPKGLSHPPLISFRTCPIPPCPKDFRFGLVTNSLLWSPRRIPGLGRRLSPAEAQAQAIGSPAQARGSPEFSTSPHFFVRRVFPNPLLFRARASWFFNPLLFFCPKGLSHPPLISIPGTLKA